MSHPHHDLIVDIIAQLAKENRKSSQRIQRWLLVKPNQAIVMQFWQQLDVCLPAHDYHYMDCCPGCGAFEVH